MFWAADHRTSTTPERQRQRCLWCVSAVCVYARARVCVLVRGLVRVCACVNMCLAVEVLCVGSSRITGLGAQFLVHLLPYFLLRELNGTTVKLSTKTLLNSLTKRGRNWRRTAALMSFNKAGGVDVAPPGHRGCAWQCALFISTHSASNDRCACMRV